MPTYSPQVIAIITLLQTLPETAQNQVVEHLQQYLMDFDRVSSQALRPAFGVMQGSGQVLGDVITPVDEPWEVLGS